MLQACSLLVVKLLQLNFQPNFSKLFGRLWKFFSNFAGLQTQPSMALKSRNNSEPSAMEFRFTETVDLLLLKLNKYN